MLDHGGESQLCFCRASVLLPEWAYGMFDGLYLMRALFSEITGRDVSWGHLGSSDA